MTNLTIITVDRILAWSGYSTPGLTFNTDAQTTSSSGATLWWWIGSGPRTELRDTNTTQFYQTPITTTYNFSNNETGAAQITLTLTGKPKV